MMIFDILAKNNSFDIIAMIFYFLYIIRKQNKTKNPPNFQDRVPSKTQENVWINIYSCNLDKAVCIMP